MDTALQPQCWSGALGREELLGQLYIAVQNGSFCACLSLIVSYCPLQGLGLAQYQMSQLRTQLWSPVLPNFVTSDESETLTLTFGRGKSSEDLREGS